MGEWVTPAEALRIIHGGAYPDPPPKHDEPDPRPDLAFEAARHRMVEAARARLWAALQAGRVEAWGTPAADRVTEPAGPMRRIEPEFLRRPGARMNHVLGTIVSGPPPGVARGGWTTWGFVNVRLRRADVLRLAPKPDAAADDAWMRAHLQAEHAAGRPPPKRDAAVKAFDAATGRGIKRGRAAYARAPGGLKRGPGRPR